MKKIITIFLVGCLFFMFVGCAGTNTASTPTSTTTAKQEPTATSQKTIITAAEARQEATSYFQRNKRELLSEITSRPYSKVKSIDKINISTTQTDKDSGKEIKCTVKGTFWGYDEYGNVEGKYNFDWTISVELIGNSYLNTSSKSINIKSAY